MLPGSGDELDLHSASEDDASPERVETESDGGTHDELVVSKSLMTFANHREQHGFEVHDEPGATASDDSETEPESDSQPTAQWKRRKSPFSPQPPPSTKHSKTLDAVSVEAALQRETPDCSETGPETEGELTSSPCAHDCEFPFTSLSNSFI